MSIYQSIGEEPAVPAALNRPGDRGECRAGLVAGCKSGAAAGLLRLTALTWPV